jgi:uncharacterized Ntn-hydrolase superfamily protein
MTFSICVRERYEDPEGEDQYRFGVAVTTRLAAVGTLCPFANEHGAVATQSLVNVELGERGIEYLADGLHVEDALDALLAADDGAAQRQLHGVDRNGTFAFSGDECKDWYGHREEDAFTVAGNLLVGEDTIDATADAYAEARHEEPAGPARPGSDEADAPAPLAERLIDALEAGHEAGGDKREDLRVQSAALIVTTTEDRAFEPSYDDLRVDASTDPIEDLRETYELARESYETTLERYGDAYEEDAMEEADEE